MKRIILLTLILMTHSSQACNYSDLLGHLEGIGSIIDVQAKDCTKLKGIFTKTKSRICKCANKNIETFKFDSSLSDKKRKIPFVMKALDKAKMGLYSTGKKILTLAVNNKKVQLAPACNLQERMRVSGKNSVFSCPNSGEKILSEDQRKQFSDQFAKSLTSELLDSYKGTNSDNGFIPRSKKENSNSCNLPEKVNIKIQSHMATSLLAPVLEILQENAHQVAGSKNIFEALTNLEATIKDTEDGELIRKIKKSIHLNPSLNYLVSSPDVFQSTLSNPDQIFNTLNSKLDSEDFIKHLENKINNECDIAFENVQKTLCLTVEDNVTPNNKDEVKSVFKSMEQNGDQNDFLITSSLLKSEYCREQPSKVDELHLKLNEVIPPNFASRDSFKTAVDDYHKTEVVEKSNKICESIPPQKKLEDLNAEIAQKCDANTNALLNQECILLKAIQANVEPKLKSKLAKIETLSLKQAKDEAVAEGKDPSDPSVTEKAIKIAKAMKDNMDADAIFGALKDKKEVDDFANDAGAQMLADFIGGETQKAATAAQPSTNEAGNGTVDSDYAQLEGSNSNSPRSSLNAASFSDGATARNQNSIPEKFRDMSPEDRETQESMNKVYDEISRRITKTRPARQAARTAAGVGPSEVYIPDDIAQAMESPYPETYESNDLYASTEGGTYDPVVNNYYDTPSIATKPLEAQSSKETASDLRKEQERGYNKALAGMQASRQVMARRDPAGTIPTPKVKISGVGANQLASKVPEMSLPSGRIDEALNELVDNAIAETGISESNEANTDQAENLLKLLDPDKNGSFILKDDENENLKVRIAKVNGKFVIKEFYGNEADPAYKKFRRKIERSLLLKDNFKGLIKKLNSALSISTNISDDSLSNSKEDNRRFN